MTVTITMSQEPFPAFHQSDAQTWASDPSQQTFVRVQPVQPRRSIVPPSLAFKDIPKPAFGVSIIKTDTNSISSPKCASIADKSLPPTPFGEAFGHDEGEISPDSDRLLDEPGEDVEVSSELPSKMMLEEAALLPVIDANGVEMPFRNVYMPSNALEKKRVMVIFVRHFFCGNCQEYLRSLTSAIPSPSTIPDGTELIIIGCGSPSLITMYKEETSCPFPVYADPTKRLYRALGMGRTLNLGRNDPEYIHRSLLTGMFQSVVQGVKRLGEGDAFRGGDMRQIGGEFIFEASRDWRFDYGKQEGAGSDVDVKVTWCHRMRNTRDHAEIRVICRVLGVECDSDSEKNKSFNGEPKWRRRQRQPGRRWTVNLAHAMAVANGHRHSWSKLSKSIDAGKTGIFGKSSRGSDCTCDHSSSA
ncbi:hypothetical protein DTO212C5_5133 [Paecilomyces variotii]|nr:hypothetical protein DTO212C5_5133 [Paecilomyces variotii]